jgi:hypothetical protein
MYSVWRFEKKDALPDGGYFHGEQEIFMMKTY